MMENKKLKKNNVEFGKFQINEIELHAHNKLMVSYLSGSPFMPIKSQKISDELASIIIEIIDTKGKNEVDIKKVNRLSEKERNIFSTLVIKAGLSKDIKYKETPLTVDDMIARFELLQGAIIAGNNSPIIVEEVVNLIKMLNLAGKINDIDSLELLNELKKD